MTTALRPVGMVYTVPAVPGGSPENNEQRQIGEQNMYRGQSLQDPFLNMLRKERVPVSIFLVNGIKLQGQIESFDQFVVLLRNSVSQMVYKHAISTVVPSRNMRLPRPDETKPSRADEAAKESGNR